MARLALGSIALFATITLVLSCSSGIGRNARRPAEPAAVLNPNRATGIDLGVTPTTTPTQPTAAGVVVPAIGATPARDVMLLAFTTSSPANDADGSGRALSRDTVTDTNGANDVFVAAVSAQDIETRAFSQSLAGKFRFPRCTTCHSLQASDSLAFATSQPHAGPAPGASFPNNTPSACTQCHGSTAETTSPVPLWQAPAASFDFRRKTVAQLAAAADSVPNGDISHFREDPRVLWALDSGLLPTFGGRNGVADDDHDGVLEPEDSDGTPRPVPGGAAVLINQIEDYIASGRVVTTAGAVKDVTLASRANGTLAASNGASTTPRLLWVPNGSFDPTNSTTARNTNPIGTLFVAFASTGSDIAGTDANGVSDVFRAAIELRAEEATDGTALSGGLNLVYLDGSTVLCSARNGTTTAGNGASTQPSIGGATADTVAFHSLATNLITAFVDANGAGSGDVYVRKVVSQTTALVSHSVLSTSTTGDGSSERPALDATGAVVAFDSAATNLAAGDTNALRDAYYANVNGSSPFTKVRASVTNAGAQATGGDSSAASVHVAGSRVRVAFQSDATNLETGLVAPTNVYLFDSSTGGGTTQLLNRRRTTSSSVIGDGSARAPVISSDGLHVVFESDAGNIDAIRATDLNRTTDVFVVPTSQLANLVVAPSRISVTTREGADGNGASTAPWFGAFTGSTNFPVGFVAYSTDATNLGTSDSTKLMVGFLTETTTITKATPTASFTAAATNGITPSITFTDTSTQLPTSWLWDFGDSTTSTLQNPVHVYTGPGTFTVQLTVTNEAGSASTTSSSLPVVANFFAPTTSGPAPLTVNLTNRSINATSFLWDFGDGTTATTPDASKVYSSGGSFVITLTSTGPGGTDTATTTVTATSSASFTITGSGLGSFPSAYESTSVTFTSTSTGGPTSFSWDFDSVANPSGTTATGATVTRSFPNVTTSLRDYVVRLTVNGPGGSAQTTRTLRIVSDTETTTLNPNADNTIYENATNSSNGFGTDFYVGRTLGTGGTLSRRGLLKFNVPASGTIPANSTISAATVTLTFSQALNTGAQSIGFHRVTSDWTEGSTNGGPQGAAAAGGGATWARRSTPSDLWTNPGGDFNLVATSTLTAAAALSGTSTTGSLQSDVQAWVNGSASNFGWLLRGNEGVVQTVKRFASRENATAGNRPTLNVTFTRPLP